MAYQMVKPTYSKYKCGNCIKNSIPFVQIMAPATRWSLVQSSSTVRVRHFVFFFLFFLGTSTVKRQARKCCWTQKKKIYLVQNIQFPGRHSKGALQKQNSIFLLYDPNRNTINLMTFF